MPWRGLSNHSHMCDLTRNEQTRASVGRMLDSFRAFEEQR